MATTNTSNTAIEKRHEKENTVNVPARREEAASAAWYTPLVDVIENDDAFVFQADLPGVKAQELNVSFENGTLTIEGRPSTTSKSDTPVVR